MSKIQINAKAYPEDYGKNSGTLAIKFPMNSSAQDSRSGLFNMSITTEEQAVSNYINLLLTDRGERLMQPNVGGNIKAMLFENITPAVLKLIEEQIRTTIKLHEPRATLIDVIVSSNIDDNAVNVKIVFIISTNAQPISLSLILERTR